MTGIGCSQTDERSAGILHRDVLAELIIEASAFFETDQSKAKRCIEHAAELVRRKQSLQSSGRGSLILRGGMTGSQIRQLRTYIDANIGDRILCDELAALARISVGHLFRAFRVSFGVSPQAYIMRRRILRAEMLMLSTNQPLASIALNCGMSDQAHFSHAFRRLVGVSPNVWRREYRSADGRQQDSWPSPTAVALSD
jgi:AraC family transcriptional regulator